jgi:hypothetical protein
MAYNRSFYSMLRKDRDDAKKAQLFDAWYASLPENEQAVCDNALYKLTTQRDFLGPHQAKAILVDAVVLVNMRPDERERWIERGEYLRAQYEWMVVGKD